VAVVSTGLDRELLHLLVDAVRSLQRRALREERVKIRTGNLPFDQLADFEQRLGSMLSDPTGGIAEATALLDDIHDAQVEGARLKRG